MEFPNQMYENVIDFKAAHLERRERGKDWLAQRFIDGELDFIVADANILLRVLPEID